MSRIRKVPVPLALALIVICGMGFAPIASAEDSMGTPTPAVATSPAATSTTVVVDAPDTDTYVSCDEDPLNPGRWDWRPHWVTPLPKGPWTIRDNHDGTLTLTLTDPNVVWSTNHMSVQTNSLLGGGYPNPNGEGTLFTGDETSTTVPTATSTSTTSSSASSSAHPTTGTESPSTQGNTSSSPAATSTPKDATGDFTLTGVCGVGNDTVATTQTNATASESVYADGNVSVTFTASAGHLFSNGAATLTVTKPEANTEACLVQTPYVVLEPVVDCVAKTITFRVDVPEGTTGEVDLDFLIYHGDQAVFGSFWGSDKSGDVVVNLADLSTSTDGTYTYQVLDDNTGAEVKSGNFTLSCSVPPPVVKKATAVNGVFTDVCGRDSNLTFTPTVTEGVRYVETRSGNTITVKAEALEGYTLTNPSWSQTATDALVACEVDDLVLPQGSVKLTCDGGSVVLDNSRSTVEVGYSIVVAYKDGTGEFYDFVLKGGEALSLPLPALPAGRRSSSRVWTPILRRRRPLRTARSCLLRSRRSPTTSAPTAPTRVTSTRTARRTRRTAQPSRTSPWRSRPSSRTSRSSTLASRRLRPRPPTVASASTARLSASPAWLRCSSPPWCRCCVASG